MEAASPGVAIPATSTAPAKAVSSEEQGRSSAAGDDRQGWLPDGAGHSRLRKEA
ncbi:hypothetical protein [Pseudarthrobacter sp.]|uniref:hypothetical protein n=1 Tax=Pseudarthrobacter sp. TaxID=1934409 RepID=UPI002FCCACF9